MTNTEQRSAVIVADLSGTIVHYNSQAEELFGHPGDEAVGSSLDLIVPPDFREAHWAGFHGAMATAHADLEGTAVHLPVVCRDGRMRVFPGVLSVVRDPYGAALGAVATYGEASDEAEPFTPVPIQQASPGTG